MRPERQFERAVAIALMVHGTALLFLGLYRREKFERPSEVARQLEVAVSSLESPHDGSTTSNHVKRPLAAGESNSRRDAGRRVAVASVPTIDQGSASTMSGASISGPVPRADADMSTTPSHPESHEHLPFSRARLGLGPGDYRAVMSEESRLAIQ